MRVVGYTPTTYLKGTPTMAKRNYTTQPRTPPQQVVYRGYLISKLFATDEYAVSKDAFHICYAPSVPAAKVEVDKLF